MFDLGRSFLAAVERRPHAVAVSGKVAAVGGRMLQGASKVIIGQIFTRLSQRVSGQAISTGWWARLRASLGVLFGKGGAQ